MYIAFTRLGNLTEFTLLSPSMSTSWNLIGASCWLCFAHQLTLVNCIVSSIPLHGSLPRASPLAVLSLPSTSYCLFTTGTPVYTTKQIWFTHILCICCKFAPKFSTKYWQKWEHTTDYIILGRRRSFSIDM